jgi:lysophospholipase L1-like esterase
VKTILAYGDSLTWGMNAATMTRHAYEDQWPSVLEAGLEGRARVVNLGLNGRTTMFDDHATAADRNGARALPTLLAMFDPIDLVIIMLGSNDVKTFVAGSPVAAAQGVRRLIEIVRLHPYEGGCGPPAVLLVAPPHIQSFGPSVDRPLMSPRTPDANSLAAVYEEVAKATGTSFFASSTVASVEGGGDGVHLDAANTRAIGAALVPAVADILDTVAKSAA